MRPHAHGHHKYTADAPSAPSWAKRASRPHYSSGLSFPSSQGRLRHGDAASLQAKNKNKTTQAFGFLRLKA